MNPILLYASNFKKKNKTKINIFNSGEKSNHFIEADYFRKKANRKRNLNNTFSNSINRTNNSKINIGKLISMEDSRGRNNCKLDYVPTELLKETNY